MIEGISNRQPLRANTSSGESSPARDLPAKAGTAAGTAQRDDALAARASSATAPVDVAKVTALREAIAKGAYKPDAAAIAERIIAFDSGLKSR